MKGRESHQEVPEHFNITQHDFFYIILSAEGTSHFSHERDRPF
jgi:hypothetical protein